MLRSLYSGVSGLAAHQTKMDVIGNNIANVNTYGFKSSRVTFSDIYYQNVVNATGGNATSGGVNPSQVGYGAGIGSIDTIMSRSGFQMTDSGLDMAIAGEGFFQVQDKTGNVMYTRAGILSIDSFGNLVDANGNFILGVTGDPTGQPASTDRIQIIVPDVKAAAASANKTILGSTVNISVADNGTKGNMTVNFVHGTPPTASLNGSNLTVTFDQNAKYSSLTELQSAVDEAIRLGGVTLPAGAISLSIDPSPTNTSSIASNYIDAGGQKLTITAGEYGKAGNAIEVSFKTGDTAGAEWDGDKLVVTAPAGTTITQTDLEGYITAANTAAGITAGSAKDVSVTMSGDISIDDLTGNAVKLTGGENTFFENMAGLLGTVKLDGGRVDATQTVGDLTSLSVGNDGVITGTHAVHGVLTLGRIDLVTFDNPAGLEQSGSNYFSQSANSGNPKLTEAGFGGSGSVVSGALEMSNVDLAQEFADMITTQRGFQANSRVITTSDEILQELVNLKR